MFERGDCTQTKCNALEHVRCMHGLGSVDSSCCGEHCLQIVTLPSKQRLYP